MSFKAALEAAASDKIHAVEGLPVNVTSAATFARAESGAGAMLVSHMVLTALMAEEHTTSSTEWVLQCYAVWAVMTSPVSVATIGNAAVSIGNTVGSWADSDIASHTNSRSSDRQRRGLIGNAAIS
ncbi:hypothetical protein B0H14DRAFT_3496376 [Mycena olivaceomarginata]|nr:hypothetical protein B0H14DRAFT_3496376 [Mycena olivaceomarginata]